jgi:hypothetical protein
LEVWTPLIQLSKKIEGIFDDHYNRNSSLELFDGWKDNIWSSKYVRKCHLKTIDNRESQKLWLMHVNIFPHEHFNFPILGFDIVAGPSKITGSFFDFSPTTENVALPGTGDPDESLTTETHASSVCCLPSF